MEPKRFSIWGSSNLLALGISILLFLSLAIVFWAPIFDDAFISMRYAQNWADGTGLVFNPGEYVEGFSDPLWVFLLGVFTKLGFPIEDTARLLGGLSAALVIAVCGLTAGSADGRIRGGRVAALLLALSGEFAYYAVAGLETTLFSVILLTAGLVWQPQPSLKRSLILALLGLLAALTRPEGAIILAAILGSNVILNWRDPGRWVLPTILTSISVGLLLLARWTYYDALLPNTFLAKPFVASQAYLLSALRFLYGYFLVDARYIVCIFALGSLIWYRRNYMILSLASLVGVGLLFMAWSGGHPRFFTPYLPALYLLAGNMMVTLGSRGKKWNLLMITIVLLLASLSIFSTVQRASFLYLGGRDPSGHSFGHAAVGRWLQEHTAPEASVLAWEIGAIGFYSDRRILDTQGLIDREVATLYYENQYNPYIYWIDPGKSRALGAQAVRLLLDRGADYALLEYHGDIYAHVDPRLIVPQDSYRAVVEERGFILFERFVLDVKLPKSFLLYGRPDIVLQPDPN